MNTSLPRVILALFALTFIVAACASDTGAEWTYAPVTASESEAQAPAESATASEPTAAPAQPEQPAASEAAQAPAESAAPEQPAVASGEPRVIALQADAALRFTDATRAAGHRHPGHAR